MKKKRIAAMGLAVIMALTGCSAGAKNETAAPGTDAAKAETTAAASAPESKSNKEVVTLRLWGGVPAEAGPQASCDLFNEQFKDKGIQVEYERFVNDETGNLKLETNLLSGTGVDLYMTYSLDVLAKRSEGNMALDLSEFAERDSFDMMSYTGGLAEAYYVNGKPYGIPTKLDKYGIVINKDMFEEAGIEIPTEWTFDEFREIAKQLTHGEGQDKVYGFFWNSQQDLTYILSDFVATALGGDMMYKSETESNFNDPVIVKGVELMNNMMNVDKTAPTHTDSVTQKLSQEGMFLTGKSAMTIGPWMVRSIKDTANYPHDFETAFAPYPVVSLEEKKFTQGGCGDLLCINPKSEHVEEAWEFAKWYATEGMLPVVAGGRVPSFNTYDVKEVTDMFLTGGEGLLDPATTEAVLIAPADNYAVPSITNHIAEIKKVFTEEVEKVLIGQQTPEEGMENAKTRSDEILQK